MTGCPVCISNMTILLFDVPGMQEATILILYSLNQTFDVNLADISIDVYGLGTFCLFFILVAPHTV